MSYNQLSDYHVLARAVTTKNALTVSSGATINNTLTASSDLTIAGTFTQADCTMKTVKAFTVTSTELATTGVETDSAYDLPAQAMVYDVFVNITTPSTATTKTMYLGTSGDTDGFLVAVSTSSTGLQYARSGAQLGALLSVQAGTTSAVEARVPYATDSSDGGALSLYWYSGATGDSGTLNFDCYVTLAELG